MLRGRFFMLEDKLASTIAAGQELAGTASTTPRLLSRVRGRFLTYGCAIPFIQVAAASLSQAMHGREGGLGPCAVPTLQEEGKATGFDWPGERLSSRTRRTLRTRPCSP